MQTVLKQAWIIEYGEPGFVPGTGAELGTLNVTDTVGTVTGLEGNTDYDFYVVVIVEPPW